MKKEALEGDEGAATVVSDCALHQTGVLGIDFSLFIFLILTGAFDSFCVEMMWDGGRRLKYE